ncbi:probable serine/threonine-protein kinase WNK9 [Chenopodium quinoa]|uniref:non-specific serine/threonine protein kinase n=1 Tax=Chenopodium quinoa TaxID=63459 RepID=A0A803MY91_CHEQI|nr:probable serine/threonine-protein kinase WNK9 [Chenopodium quinoa]
MFMVEKLEGMNAVIDHDDDSEDSSDYVERDPTGRYGRYNEILGKGSSKIVYKGFDEYNGTEVAWNQVKLTDFLQRPEDLERLYSEIHLLKTLKHKNIMKFYTSWVDINNRNINFVTEMFTSGTLRQYRVKHKKVNIRAVKHWCRQILEGLLYLHSHNPPVIHRDLKCDNIFINGNQGEVKIGDLGLAAILRKSHAARCVGTPEFMAPEVYAEEYNELVDIYSFGMCVLEMVTFDYPYSECTHPAQIYKKVVSGKKPDALYKVKNLEVRLFVDKCLATVSARLSAKELLEDPFLRCDDDGYDFRPIDFDKISPIVQIPCQNDRNSSSGCDYAGYEPDHEHEYQTLELAANEIELFTFLEDDDLKDMDISIKGKKRANGDIFLRLRITDKEGRVRNIYFPFDVETDTAMSVTTEMVSELSIKEDDMKRIADMIDCEITSLVPDWKKSSYVEEAAECESVNEAVECRSIDEAAECESVNEDNDRLTEHFSLADYLSFGSPRPRNLQLLRCASHGSTSMRGRFEEITYPSEADLTDSGVKLNTETVGHHHRRPSLNFHFGETFESQDQSSLEKDKRATITYIQTQTPYNSPTSSILDEREYENEAMKELRWLKTKYEIQLRELNDENSGADMKTRYLAAEKDYNLKRSMKISFHPLERGLDVKDLKKALEKHFTPQFPSAYGKRKIPNLRTRMLQSECCSPDNMGAANNYYTGAAMLPHSLQRTTSLPVDALDF